MKSLFSLANVLGKSTGNLSEPYTNWQLTFLVVLRVLIGWHLLYEGAEKLFDPDWSSMVFLLDSKGFLSGFFIMLANHQDVTAVVDFLNIWGLIAIGLGMIMGLFTRFAIIAGIILLSFYYLSHPPFPGLEFTIPSEGNYLFVNKNLVELFALVILLMFPTGHVIGVDRLLGKRPD